MSSVNDAQVKQQVRQFYDQIGWKTVGEGVYQNAQYEDLRPVSREYIHLCHLRVGRHLAEQGRLFLDAGSGPIQYPEYLEYSRGYQARVCSDISMVALQEARQRIGDRGKGGHGLFVVADIAYLPFRADIFDGLISLHTIHHLPMDEHLTAYLELERVLISQRTGVIVNGWDSSLVNRIFVAPLKWVKRTRKRLRRFQTRFTTQQTQVKSMGLAKPQPKGTFVSKNNAQWLQREIGERMPIKILVWRSVSVRFLKAYVHAKLGGKYFLRLLYWLEERHAGFFGRYGQYPLILIQKK